MDNEDCFIRNTVQYTYMEGTRSERVAILLVSYVIGFITAYIAFGVTQLSNTVELATIANQSTASAIMAERQAQRNSIAFIAMDKEGLVLIKDNKRTLLSATVDTQDSTFLEEGAHVAIVDYSLSPDKKSVYFCELPASDVDSCRPYIYSITDDVVYPVEVNGERVAFDAETQSISWSDAGELIIN